MGPDTGREVTMIEVHGRQVFTEIEEIVDPRHTALIVIDMQNDFCSEGGLMHQIGKDLSMMKPMLGRLRGLLDAARAAGVMPIYIQNTWLPDHRIASGAWLRFMVVRYGMDPARGCTVEGTWGAEILPEIAPCKSELVVRKWRSSAFRGTSLDMILRCNEVKSVVVTGVVTQGCVESTARDAAFHDYYPVLAEDCVATYERDIHEASLKVLRTRVDVVPSSTIIETWQRARPG
jgi:nicotinamidase-related amidase